MNELALEIEKAMTMQEIAQAMGVSKDTVRNCVRRIFPAKMKQGKTAYFDEKEIACISKDIANNTDIQKQIKGTNFMTIRNIADVLNVSYSAVYRVVSKLFPDKMENGKAVYLNEQEIACVSKALKGDYHTSQMTFSAGEKVKNTTTELEVIANYKQATEALVSMLNAKNQALQAENERQKQQLAIAEPKAQWFDEVADSSNLVEIGTVGKMLGIGQNNFFAMLKMNKVIYKKRVDDIEYYLAYSEYEKYFKSVPIPFKKSDGTKLTRIKLMFTQDGAQWAEKRFSTRG